ncbi:MAG: outer membrane protein OmpA-like peptidoglycan-associated protein [Crocinitomicaceae bacterium]|jgi:outer membrane protein OmpA-like peptidoglycan-associated protein/tetratricopeptide (TPR) repeat protein
MMKYIFTLVILSICTAVTAQNVEFKSANFKDDKEGFKNAMEAIKKGDEYFELGNEAFFFINSPGLNFDLAKQQYMKAQDLNPDNGALNFKIGVCLLNSSYSQLGIPYLFRANELDPACDPFFNFHYGYALQLDGQYVQAKKSYNKFSEEYKKSDDFNKFVTKRKNECLEAINGESNPVRAWVDNVTELNTEFDEYAPSISVDGGELIMTSNRPNGHDPNEVGGFDDDIYSSTRSDGKWSSAEPLKGGVNTREDDVSNNLSYDGTKMLLHRVEDGQTDIFESKLVGDSWIAPDKLPFQISSNRSNEVFAAYSADGWSIYFSRDNAIRSNGLEVMYSGMQSKIQKNYMAAQMISTVNSKFNDGPVYIHIDGETMYLASEGTGSIGGYDIFVSINNNGTWSKPKNMGYPINTQYDDFFFSATANGKFAYIASNRKGGKGGYDIYKVTFWGAEKEPVTASEDYLLASVVNPVTDNSIESTVTVKKKSFTVFKGKTIDALTKNAVESSIEITDNTSGNIIETFTTNSATGKFIITLASGKNYGIAVKADGYLFHSENFDIPMGSADNLVNKVIELYNIKIGSKIALRNVFFDTGKSILRSESNAELGRLVQLMKDVPGLKVEISGHTDNTGSAELNESLSQDRAQAVVNYLKAKGVSGGRMKAQGYGSSRPVDSNNTSDGRQQNRRTEFEITGN